jgi:succinate-semialdehyde dehydrogenase
VGAGNVQALVDRGLDYREVALKIIDGRAFDNGIICAAEQSVILPREDFAAAMQAFAVNGSYIVPQAERGRLRELLFPGGHMNRDMVGKNAAQVAEAAGLAVPVGTRILLIEAAGGSDVLGGEKMFPVLAAYRYDTWEEAVEIARGNLAKTGLGHTVALHSTDNHNIEYAATHIEVSRLVVNQSCASSAGGSFFNGLNPTNTLGCGSWGNNSIAENLTYYHLINISRIACFMKDNKVPSEEEIWT